MVCPTKLLIYLINIFHTNIVYDIFTIDCDNNNNNFYHNIYHTVTKVFLSTFDMTTNLKEYTENIEIKNTRNEK